MAGYEDEPDRSGAPQNAVGDGMDRGRAAEIRDLGRTLEGVPAAEEQLRDARVTPQAAAAVGKVIRRAETAKQPPDPDALAAEAQRLIELSKEAERREFRGATRKAEEEVAQRGREAFAKPAESAGEECAPPSDRLIPRTFVVTETALDRFLRAKCLAERKAERTLSEGEAFTFVTDDYLKRHDPS